jgi:fatty acid-binding protein DegV
MLKETYGTKNVFIHYIGAVIGSHAGPGTMAVFYLGNKR